MQGNKSVGNEHSAVKKTNMKTSNNISTNNNLVNNTNMAVVNNKSNSMFGHPPKRNHLPPPVQSHPPNATSPVQPPTKKPKLGYLKDMSAADAGKHATLAEYAFFDKVCFNINYFIEKFKCK